MKIIRETAVFFALMSVIALSAARSFAGEAQGDKFFEEKKYRKAIQEYEQAVESGGETEALLAKLAKSYDALNWYGQSVQYWEKYVAKYPNGKDFELAKKKAALARRWLALNFYNLGESIDTVIRQLELAIKLDPTLYDAYYWLGRVCLEDGRFEKAVATLEKLVSLYPDDKRANWLLKEARGMLQFGGKAYAAYSQGYGLYKKGEFDAAIKKYEEAVAENPKFANAFIWIARIYFEGEQFDKAVPYWKKALELQPGNKRAEWFLKLSQRKAKEKKRH